MINFQVLFSQIQALTTNLYDINQYQVSTIPTMISNITTNLDESVYDGVQSQQTNAQTAASSFAQYQSTLATNQVNLTVFNDTPLLNQSIQTNLNELIAQMNADSQTVQAAAVGSSITSDTTGDGVLVCSTLDANGYACEMSFPENVIISCTADSTGSATAGNERFSAQGEPSATNGLLSWNFPQGSGSSQSLTAVSPSSSIMNNGDFENWTGSVPNNWTITAGASNIAKESVPYTGSFSLGITGDGSTLTALEQQFGNSAGTTKTLSNSTQYAFNCWMQAQAGIDSGVLVFELVDGDGTQLQDNAGNVCALDVDLTTLSTSYTAVNACFRTPYILPDEYYFRIRLNNALTADKIVYIDRLCFAATTQLYTSGPSFIIFSGSNNFYVPDSFTAAITNGHTNLSYVRAFQRFFNMASLGYRLPTSDDPTIGF